MTFYAAAGKTLTVGELRDALNGLDPNAPVTVESVEFGEIAGAENASGQLTLTLEDSSQAGVTHECEECDMSHCDNGDCDVECNDDEHANAVDLIKRIANEGKGWTKAEIIAECKDLL